MKWFASIRHERSEVKSCVSRQIVFHPTGTSGGSTSRSRLRRAWRAIPLLVVSNPGCANFVRAARWAGGEPLNAVLNCGGIGSLERTRTLTP